MLEEKLAQDGSPIVIQNGRHLCSKYNPIKEAQDWVKAHHSQMSRTPQIVVLGAGCGYHLVELVSRYPQKKIICLESSEEVIHFCERQHGLSLVAVDMVFVRSLEDVRTHCSIKKIVKSMFKIFHYSPSFNQDVELYTDIETFLTGRTQSGFEFVLSQRPSLKESIRKFKNLRVVDEWQGDEPLMSIKDLEVDGSTSGASISYYNIRVLKELVR